MPDGLGDPRRLLPLDRRDSASVGWVGFRPALLIVLLGCGESSSTSPNPPSDPSTTPAPDAVAVSPEAAILNAFGDTIRFSAEVLDGNGMAMTDAAVEWRTADTSVAVVDSAGHVTSVGNGSTAVSATAGSVTGRATLTVSQEASAVAVTPGSLVFTELGDTATLAAAASDANGNVIGDPEVSWQSADLSVATVAASGLVRALVNGSTTITAAVGSVSAEVSVRVEADGAADRDALAALHGATSGENWTNDANWLSDRPLDEWHGVETDADGRVTSVDLPENGLVGTIPAELAGLTRLVTLNLRENKLTGALPPEIGDLSRLRVIDLGHTELSGEIPATLGKLVALRRLNLEYVPFTGSIPPELGALGKLEFLNLYQQRLSGSLPADLGRLRSLRTMFVDRNELTGSIPSTFVHLEKLETFFWGHNDGLCAPGSADFEAWRADGSLDFRGPRCNEADRVALERLYEGTGGADWARSTGWLDAAALGEWVGVEADSLGRVTLLDLADNGLRGQLPSSLGALDRLSVLRVGGNALSGRMPTLLQGLPLREFRYAGTELCVPESDAFRRWLASIPVREGPRDGCPPLTDREILQVLYEATGGKDWTLRDGWLTEAPLGDWHGVTADGDERVVELALYGNNLRGRIPGELGGLAALRLLDLSYNWLEGPIPPDFESIDTLEELYLESNLLDGRIPAELGSLTRLTNLYLWDNQLEGTIPRALGRLSNLEDLRISLNRLTGRIPPELGDLSSVEVIWMDENRLEGEIPPELGNLSSLRFLYLGYNNMSGSIPPELGNLPNLTDIGLDGLGLTGSIPPELGNLPNLTGELNLRENDLSGEIPAELGKLDRLKKLRLGHNNLSGSLDAVGRMLGLEWLDLSHNPQLAGPLPSSFANLGNLGRIETDGTKLCVGADSPLADPTVSRRFRLPLCDRPLERSTAYLIQSIQSAQYPVPLVAGEDALLRVFPISPASTQARIPSARATFFVGGAEVFAVDVPGQAAPIPTRLTQAEASLDRSANIRVPGTVVQPGLEMVVEIDPGGTLEPGLDVARRIPESGRMPVPVEAVPMFDLTLVPFVWQTRPDSTVVDLVGQMARNPEEHRLLWDTRTLLPVGDIEVTAHPPVLTSDNSDELLDEVGVIRALEGGTGYWMGALSGEATGSWGVAWIDGWTSYMRLGVVSQPEEALTLAHELGHNMSLYHAPCDVRSVLDPGYPHPNAAIGNWGLDTRSGRDVLVPPTWADLMSYCVPAWVSEYNLYLAMRHRLNREASAGRSAASGPALLVWGGTDDEGAPYLNPVFAVHAPPSPPAPGGQYRLVGRATGGDVLFSLSFDIKTVADREGRGGFAFAIPSRPDWTGALAEVELVGPGGSAAITAATDSPVAILRERATGLVRAILREAPAALGASETADVARGFLMPDADLEILFSRGLPRPAARPGG